MADYIPARNVLHMEKERAMKARRYDRIELLALAFRGQQITADMMTPAEREDVCAWLLNHPTGFGKRVR